MKVFSLILAALLASNVSAKRQKHRQLQTASSGLFDYNGSLTGPKDDKCALINVVMDESGSMFYDQVFMKDTALPRMARELQSATYGYKHVFVCSSGFTDYDSGAYSRQLGCTTYDTQGLLKEPAVLAWTLTGWFEDGWHALQTAIDTVPSNIENMDLLSTCGQLHKNLILVSDEDRDIYDASLSISIKEHIQTTGYVLNAVVNIVIDNDNTNLGMKIKVGGTESRIFKYSYGQLSKSPIGPTGSSLKQVAVSGDGQHVWGVNDGDQIHYRNGVSGTWEPIPGSLKQVAVSNDGQHVWGVNANNLVYYRTNGSTQGAWTRSEPQSAMKQVAVSGDGQHVWGVTAGDEIYYRNGFSGTWQQTSGALMQVAVSGDGQHVWGVTAGDKIYYRNGLSGEWQHIDGSLKQITVSNDGQHVWGVNAGDEIFYTDTYTEQFDGGVSNSTKSGLYTEYVSSAGSTHSDYSELIVGTEGAIWNINSLRDTSLADAFGEAFVAVKVEEISKQETNPVRPPEDHTGIGGDPHITTWKNEHYEYHGQCDLVLMDDSKFDEGQGLDIHIRTKIVRHWSYIKNVAIKIGDDILEIEGSVDANDAEAQYWINFEYQGELETLGGFPVTQKLLSVYKRRFTIDLSSKYPGQNIVVQLYKEFIRVNFNGKEEVFGNTVGLMGDYKTGKTLDRDGVTVINDFTELGDEWQVLPSEPKLFHEISHPQFPELCIKPEDPRGERKRRLAESSISIEQAEKACATLKDPLSMKDCVYDILATQDLDMVGAF